MDIALEVVVVQYICLLFSLCVHEAAHAKMAENCGDPSARLLGRVTLNPVAHADPIGTVLLPILMIIFPFPFLFGWAKPVPFNPANLNNIRRDPMLIAVAGPASNVVIAFITMMVLKAAVFAFGAEAVAGSPWFAGAFYLVMINFILVVFNMIPVPPLDGHYVLHYFLPPDGQRMLETIGPFGILIAIIVARPVFMVVIPPLQDFVFWFIF